MATALYVYYADEWWGCKSCYCLVAVKP